MTDSPSSTDALTVAGLARVIDHTLLKAGVAQVHIERLCDEARQWNPFSVCVNSVWVPICVDRLAGSGVAVCTVVGFPLGASLTAAKVGEAEAALALGATEIDMVLDTGAIASGNIDRPRDDIEAVAEVTHRHGGLLKVILETSLLTDPEKVIAAQMAVSAGADFVKTSTGFVSHGATVEDVRRLRDAVGPKIGVKASGGIRRLEEAEAMLAAGASRLGLSGTVAILEALRARLGQR